jgi:colanic acid/amylovoran biosynthesis glycosyltransferase
VTTGAATAVLTTGSRAAPESTDEAADVQALRELGWDAHLVMPGSGLRSSSMSGSFHGCWERPARLGAGLAMARGAAAGPATAVRSLRTLEGGTGRWCRRQLAGHFLTLRPRLIHFDSGRWAAEWMDVTEALGCAVVVTLTMEDLFATGREPFPGFGDVCSRSTALHFHDPALEQRALRHGCDGPSAAIPPPVKTTLFTPEDASGPTRAHRGLRIVSADRLEWMQGFEHAIHAMKQLFDAGVQADYTIAGDGGYLPALAFARHQLGIREHVHLPGELADAELAEVLRTADVFVSAAVVDGMPKGVLQAAASGLPVVMSDPGPLGRAAIDADAGFVVPRRDPRTLADKLALLANDERMRRDMGQAARRWALEQLDKTERMNTLTSLYREALA